jgi:hypothetical protein
MSSILNGQTYLMCLKAAAALCVGGFSLPLQKQQLQLRIWAIRKSAAVTTRGRDYQSLIPADKENNKLLYNKPQGKLLFIDPSKIILRANTYQQIAQRGRQGRVVLKTLLNCFIFSFSCRKSVRPELGDFCPRFVATFQEYSSLF